MVWSLMSFVVTGINCWLMGNIVGLKLVLDSKPQLGSMFPFGSVNNCTEVSIDVMGELNVNGIIKFGLR